MGVTRRGVVASAMAVAALPGVPASAQQHSSRIAQLIVPFPPGSLTDIVNRQIADLLGPALGYRMIVDNRGGAQGAIGMKAAAAATPDGLTTVAVGVTTGASNLFLLKDVGYDPVADFAPIGMVAESPYLLVAAPDLPVSSTRELMELARKKPGEISYSYGSGSARVAAQMIATQAKVQVLGVPYKGGLEALTDVMAGRISYTLTDFANGLPQVRAGKVKGLGVTLAKPFALAPDIPPLEQAGYGPYDIAVWFALAAPAKTPPDIVRTISEKLRQVLGDSDLKARYAGQGLLAKTSTPEEYGSFLRSEISKWGALARETGLMAG